FDEINHEEVFIDEYIHRLSHKGIPTPWRMNLGKRPPNPNFSFSIDWFLLEQWKVKNLVQLWQAFRQSDTEKIRSLLPAWPELLYAGENLKRTIFQRWYERDQKLISEVVSQGKPKPLMIIAADCIHNACLGWAGPIDSPLVPCLELIEKD